MRPKRARPSPLDGPWRDVQEQEPNPRRLVGRRTPGSARRTPLGPRAAAYRARRLRRAVAASAAGLACWLVLGPYGTGSADDMRQVLVATADRPVGHTLSASDVALRLVPAGVVPAGALADTTAAVGAVLAAPVGDGEMLTGLRLRRDGSGLPRGSRSVHVPLSDPAGATSLATGDHVDVLSVADGTVVVADAIVAQVDDAGVGPLGGLGRAGGVTLAVPAERVGPLTTAALGGSGHEGVHLAVRGTS